MGLWEPRATKAALGLQSVKHVYTLARLIITCTTVLYRTIVTFTLYLLRSLHHRKLGTVRPYYGAVVGTFLWHVLYIRKATRHTRLHYSCSRCMKISLRSSDPSPLPPPPKKEARKEGGRVWVWYIVYTCTCTVLHPKRVQNALFRRLSRLYCMLTTHTIYQHDPQSLLIILIIKHMTIT